MNEHTVLALSSLVLLAIYAAGVGLAWVLK